MSNNEKNDESEEGRKKIENKEKESKLPEGCIKKIHMGKSIDPNTMEIIVCLIILYFIFIYSIN